MDGIEHHEHRPDVGSWRQANRYHGWFVIHSEGTTKSIVGWMLGLDELSTEQLGARSCCVGEA